jgi:predicted ATPase
MVLNEPETSLHPDLLAPLARLIGEAGATTQIVVVSHASKLIKELRRLPQTHPVELIKDFGETKVEGVGPFDGPTWDWGGR